MYTHGVAFEKAIDPHQVKSQGKYVIRRVERTPYLMTQRCNSKSYRLKFNSVPPELLDKIGSLLVIPNCISLHERCQFEIPRNLFRSPHPQYAPWFMQQIESDYENNLKFKCLELFTISPYLS